MARTKQTARKSTASRVQTSDAQRPWDRAVSDGAFTVLLLLCRLHPELRTRRLKIRETLNQYRRLDLARIRRVVCWYTSLYFPLRRSFSPDAPRVRAAGKQSKRFLTKVEHDLIWLNEPESLRAMRTVDPKVWLANLRNTHLGDKMIVSNALQNSRGLLLTLELSIPIFEEEFDPILPVSTEVALAYRHCMMERKAKLFSAHIHLLKDLAWIIVEYTDGEQLPPQTLRSFRKAKSGERRTERRVRQTGKGKMSINQVLAS